MNIRTRVIFEQPIMLFFAFLFVLAMVWLSRSHAGKAIVSTQSIQATVMEMSLNQQYGQRAFDIVFQLPDGESCTLTLREPVPKRGEQAPLTQQTLKNKQKTCVFDRSAWKQALEQQKHLPKNASAESR